MICKNCGFDMPEGTSFCTNCGASMTSTSGFDSEGAVAAMGASLEAAVAANQQEMDSIEARAQAQVDAAFNDFPPIEGDQVEAGAEASYMQDQITGGYPEPPAGQAPEQPYDQAQANDQAQPGAQPFVVAAPAAAPFYQQDVSANAHYSSQRSYEGNAYGQDTGQQQYRPPAYGQPGSQPQRTFSQPATHRAFAMVLYVSGIIGIIIALCVRDKDDEFITHHLNNTVVIFIGYIIGMVLSIAVIGFLLFIYLFVMMIMGMISAYNGETTELPLIGKIHIVK